MTVWCSIIVTALCLLWLIAPEADCKMENHSGSIGKYRDRDRPHAGHSGKAESLDCTKPHCEIECPDNENCKSHCHIKTGCLQNVTRIQIGCYARDCEKVCNEKECTWTCERGYCDPLNSFPTCQSSGRQPEIDRRGEKNLALVDKHQGWDRDRAGYGRPARSDYCTTPSCLTSCIEGSDCSSQCKPRVGCPQNAPGDALRCYEMKCQDRCNAKGCILTCKKRLDCPPLS